MMENGVKHIRDLNRYLVWDLSTSKWFYNGKPLRNYTTWGSWGGCRFINPLCPDDLCRLPNNHVGSEHNIHLLGTSGEPEFLPYMENHPNKRATLQDLIDRGWKRQKEMFGD